MIRFKSMLIEAMRQEIQFTGMKMVDEEKESSELSQGHLSGLRRASEIIKDFPDDEVTCEWSRGEDCDDETWSTECGQAFTLHEEATPTECEFKFCAYCGRKLKE